MAGARMISWTQATVRIGGGQGPWSDEPTRTHHAVRLELLHNRQAGRVEARLFDRMGFELEQCQVVSHTVEHGRAVITTATGDTWTAEREADCGCS